MKNKIRIKEKYGWEFKVFGLKVIYWGKKYKDTYLSIDTNTNRYVFGLRHFKYYGSSQVSELV